MRSLNSIYMCTRSNGYSTSTLLVARASSRTLLTTLTAPDRDYLAVVKAITLKWDSVV